MAREKIYSFKLLRAFESWNNDNLPLKERKHVSWYWRWGFTPIVSHKWAVDVIHNTIIKELRYHPTLKQMFAQSRQQSGRWPDGTKLGEVMTAINRNYPENYIQAVKALQNWSHFHDEWLEKALMDVSDEWKMERKYPASM